MSITKLLTWLGTFTLATQVSTQAARQLDCSLNPEYLSVLRSGVPAQLRNALERGAPSNGRDAKGNTPLMLAAVYGDVECLRLLLERGAEVNVTNQSGATPLMRAASSYEKLRLLLDQGADVNVRSALGNTALMLAARPADSHRSVRLLLSRGADANATNTWGASVLMAAVAGGDAASVRLLLKHGANVNAQPTPDEGGFVFGGGRNPLMWAAFRGDTTIMKLLLDAGADVQGEAFLGTPLSQAAWTDSVEASRMLIQHGAPVNQKSRGDSFTPMHWAASTEHGDAALVNLLLQHGADPNLEGGENLDAFMDIPQTPLMLAKRRGETPVLDALKQAGATNGTPEAAKLKTPPPRQIPSELDFQTLRAAVSQAIAPLQKSSIISKQSFVNHSSRQDCTSCHQQYMPLAAIGMAKKLSATVDAERERELVAMIGEGEVKDRELDWQALFHPDGVYTKGYTLFGYALASLPPDELTDAAVYNLAAIQGRDGRWYGNLPRPPIQGGDIGATALAIHALRKYPLPGRKAEFAVRVDQARRWLRTVKPANHDERVFQLLGLTWAGEPANHLQSLASQLLSHQAGDGGWAQLPSGSSDAYATGQTVYALHVGAGVALKNPALDRARRYLLQTQLEDGTWYVRRRAFPFQPTNIQSGFPHGKDGWISATGTSWAVLALSLSDNQPQPAARDKSLARR